MRVVQPAPDDKTKERGIGPMVRRIICDVVSFEEGVRGKVVLYSTLAAPIRKEVHGEIRFELMVRQFLRNLGYEALRVNSRDVGGELDSLDHWEGNYKTLDADANRAATPVTTKVDLDVSQPIEIAATRSPSSKPPGG
jgi:hypothetical protein